MKNEDKKLSDDFTKFLHQKLFYKDKKEIKQTKNKLEFFNKCTKLFEEFLNSHKENAINNIDSNKPISNDNKNVMSIKVKNPLDGGKGTTIMTASESMRADEQRSK